MKILNANKFLEMPEGTVFAVYEDMKFWELYIKGVTHEDWSYECKRIVTEVVFDDKFFAAESKDYDGEVLSLNLDNWWEGPISNKDKCAVYDKKDIQELIDVLKSVIK